MADALMRLIRLLPPETAHRLALWGIRTGLWRVPMVVGAVVTLAWTTPLRLLSK